MATWFGKLGKWTWKNIKKGGDAIGKLIQNTLGLDKTIAETLSGITSNIVNKYGEEGLTDREIASSDLQLRNQQQLNEEEYERKIDFYERYESPEAQVRQYKAAGLNPALMFGNGASVSASGGIGSAGSAASPDVSAQSPLNDVLGTILNVKRFGLEQAANKAQVSNLMAEEERTAAETISKKIENKYAEERNAEEIRRLKAENARTEAETENVRANLPLILANTKYAETMALYAPDYFDATIGESRSNALRNKSQVSLNDAQISELNAKTSLHKKEMAEIDSKIALIASEIELNASQKGLNEQSIIESQKRVNKLEDEIRYIGKQIGLAEKDIEYYIWNHPRSSGGLGIKWNTSSENGRTTKGEHSENDMVFLLRQLGYTVEPPK